MATILVVDDEDELRALLASILEREGHEVSTARNGQEGLAMIQAGNFDLIITDLDMPEMRGDEMLLRADHPCAIIASARFSWLTTNADKVREIPRLDALIGHCTFLAKPFKIEELRAATNDLLARSVQ